MILFAYHIWNENQVNIFFLFPHFSLAEILSTLKHNLQMASENEEEGCRAGLLHPMRIKNLRF
jgi:hypothetical protein